MNSKQNLVVFSAATDSEYKISSNTTQKGTKQIWCQFSLLGQEPTFKSSNTGTYKIKYAIFFAEKKRKDSLK